MNDQDNVEILPREEASSSSLVSKLERAGIETQIATAKQYPRSMVTVKKRITELATLDDESAKDSIYAIKRAGKVIKGPSIRFAEILKQAFGNCRSGSRVVETNKEEGYVEAEGVFHDLETNSATTKRVRRNILTSKGEVYSADMINTTGNAACSIALRNAVLDSVPKPLWREAFEIVEAIVAGNVETLSERRDAMVKSFAIWGIGPEQITAYMGKETIDDLVGEDLVILTGVHSSIKNGEETVESVFYQANRVAAKNNRSNPFAGAKEEAPKTTEKVKVDTDKAEEKKPKEEIWMETVQDFSDHLWKAARTKEDLAAEIDQFKADHMAGKVANKNVAGAIHDVEQIHLTRVTAEDPEGADELARIDLANIDLESPDAFDVEG